MLGWKAVVRAAPRKLRGGISMSTRGFVRFPQRAFEDRELGSTDLLVLLAIASFSNSKTGTAFPSQGKIAARARCARQTANRAISRLNGRGWLKVEHRCRRNGSQSSNGYVVLGGSSDTRGPFASATAQSVSTVTPNRNKNLSNHLGCHGHGAAGLDTEGQGSSGGGSCSVDPRYSGPQMPVDTAGLREIRRLERELLGERKFRTLFAALRRDGRTVIAPDRSHMRRLYDEFAPLLRAEGATEIVVSFSADKCRL